MTVVGRKDGGIHSARATSVDWQMGIYPHFTVRRPWLPGNVHLPLALRPAHSYAMVIKNRLRTQQAYCDYGPVLAIRMVRVGQATMGVVCFTNLCFDRGAIKAQETFEEETPQSGASDPAADSSF